MSYNPKSLAYVLLNVLPGTNQDVVNCVNKLAIAPSNKGIDIKEIAITMGSEDIIIKIESSKRSDGLDAWIVNDFQSFLRNNCRDPETGELFVKETKTLRAMRDI